MVSMPLLDMALSVVCVIALYFNPNGNLSHLTCLNASQITTSMIL